MPTPTVQTKTKKLVIVGDSALAEIAHEYFDVDTEYEVVAFSVERDYLEKETLHGLPVVAFEDLVSRFPPADHDVFVGVAYTHLNYLRARLATESKQKGYKLASYVSPRAFVWRNAVIGENCFIFEDNTIQPYTRIGDNVVMWSGNHLGHHSVIEDNCFIASHVVISGFCVIGHNTFMGVNSTVANNVVVGCDNWIGLGATITRNTPDNTLYKGQRSEPAPIGAREFFKVPPT